MMLNYKNGPPKYQCLHFYTMNIVYAIEYHPYRPHIRVPWWKRCSKCMLWCTMSELPHQQIFNRGDHFHLLQRRAAHSATIVRPWWTVIDYCIPQHRHRGCCPFVGGSRPERSKFVSELPHLPYKTHYYKPCRYHRTSQFFNVSAWNIENGRVWGRGKRKFWINWYISNKQRLMRN